MSELRGWARTLVELQVLTGPFDGKENITRIFESARKEVPYVLQRILGGRNIRVHWDGQIKAISAVVVSTKDGEGPVPPVSEESRIEKMERLQEGLYQAVKAAADKGLIPESYGILQALDALTAFKLSGEKDE